MQCIHFQSVYDLQYTENERFSEAQLHANNSILGGGGGGGGNDGGSRKKGTRATVFIQLSGKDAAFADLGLYHSTVVLVEAEIFKYINYMKLIMLSQMKMISVLPCLLSFYSKGNFGGDNS